MPDEEWEKLDKREKAIIFLSLSSDVLFNVSTEKTLKELWENISLMYEMASTSNKVFIMKRLYNLKMKEGGIVSNHLNEFNTLVTQLVLVDISLDDEIKAILLLCSLPNSWEGVVLVVSTSVATKNKLKFDDVVATLPNKDMRRKNQETSFGEALTTVSRGRPRNKGKDNTRRRSKYVKRSKSRGRIDDCRFCGKAGHTKKDCYSYKKAQEKVRESEGKTIYDKDDSVLVISISESISDSVVLDSGA